VVQLYLLVSSPVLPLTILNLSVETLGSMYMYQFMLKDQHLCNKETVVSIALMCSLYIRDKG
jgi:hypothetical protein